MTVIEQRTMETIAHSLPRIAAALEELVDAVKRIEKANQEKKD